ncbi:MAG: ectoine/hydroxyectoine ABC transporter substrate-binding protein EhuB [Alcaligenaceae bacterium]|jgi:polar amino acid transport system substrate-binding protein|nr:ectoine/hydroxyectoine ABC transporter substrate-binding protein EhuB [Alcaligenaceae bacterium]
MKSLLTTPLSILTAALALSTSVNAASLEEIKEQGYVRIAVANEIPYGYVTPSNEAKGAGPDIAKLIMKNLGIDEIRWVTTGFGSLIPGLKADRFDMVAAEMAILPQRCSEVLFSEPNSSYGEGLLVAKGNPKDIHTYEDFSNSDLKVAIMAGADQLEMMQALGVDDSRMVTIANNADSISTIATGRADAYAATSLTVSELASNNRVEAAADFKDPIINGNPVRSWGGFTFAQSSSDLQEAVNQELQELKKTDEWKEILLSYGFSETDVQESFSRTTAQLCE